MKKILILLCGSLALAACNSGSSSTPSGYTLYNLQNYKFSGTQLNNCTIQGNSNLNCDATGSFFGIYTITYNGGTSAYVVMPTTNSLGVEITETGSGCPQTAAASGSTYTCQFKVAANGTAQKGTINIQVTSKLNPTASNVVTVNLQ